MGVRRHKVSRAAEVTHDLDLIEEHLTQAYQDLGDDLGAAMDRAEARIVEALAYLRTFASDPHRGTEHPAIRPGIRTVTNKNFIIDFEIDEASSEVRILATFSTAPTTDGRSWIDCRTDGVSYPAYQMGCTICTVGRPALVQNSRFLY